MSPDPPIPVNMWRYSRAPREFRELFPDARDTDWVAYVPEPQRQALEPYLLRWHEVYPVRCAELPDHSLVYCGAPRQALELVTAKGRPVSVPDLGENERRTAVRVRFVCPSRYETHTEPRQAGTGQTIDLSNSGISFTTESHLPANARVTLHMRWPARLQGDVPIELRAVGRLARTEAWKAAVEMDSITFDIAP